MLSIDLHCHSTVSDGLLTPGELVRHAAAQGVTTLALTDHDDLGGLEEAAGTAREIGIRFVPGTEVSATWKTHTIHIVGLHVDADRGGLAEALADLRAGRVERAGRIAAELEKAGIPDSLAGAYKYANERIISRTHFARFLVEKGYAKDVRSVFKKYLKKGKPGHVQHSWASVADAVAWIRAAGGIAVVAHPGRYDLGRVNMLELLSQFRDAGGAAIEVVCGSHTAEHYRLFAEYARYFGLAASAGSDYHGPKHSHLEMGRLPDLPAGCRPVWSDW